MFLGRCLGVVLALAFVVNALGDTPCCMSSAPEQIHLSLSDDVTTIIAMWTTANPAESFVQVGASANTYASSFNGTSHTYTVGGWVGVLHAVAITGLQPFTRYHYRVGGTSSGFSDDRFFTTAPAKPNRPMVMGVVGDMGAINSNMTIRRLTDLVKEHNEQDGTGIDLMIHNGDISYANGVQHIWDVFQRLIDPIASYVPYMVTVGNHEAPYNFTAYKNRFSMPGPNTEYTENTEDADDAPPPPAWEVESQIFYNFEYSGIFFVAVSTEHSLALNSTQIRFLEQTLAAAAARRAAGAITWIIMMTHRPLYCSNTRDDEVDCFVRAPIFRKELEWLLKEYKVDLYLSAHEHSYERMHPVMDTVPCPGLVDATCPVHIMNGAAGCPEDLDHFWREPRPAWSAFRDTAYGYGVLTVDDVTNSTYSILNWKFYDDLTNHLVDEFSLLRTKTQA